MKRILAILSVSLVLGSFGVLNSLALVEPKRPMLPDLDRRTADKPAAPALAPAAADLKVRVPDLQITMDEVLGTPNYFGSRSGFLTGPQGVGGAVQPASAQAFAAEDRHRAIKAFLNEHAGLLGYGAEALSAAVVNRDYVTDHNGLRTVVWQQQLDGIPVYQAIVMGHITKRGELVNLTTQFVPSPANAADAGVKNRAAVQVAPPITVQQAIANAAHNVGENTLVANQVTAVGAVEGADFHQKLKAAPALSGETDARLVWLPLSASTMRLCWQFILVSASRTEMFTILVDAENGEVLYRRNQNRYLTDATYRVFPGDSPSPFSPGWFAPSTAQPPLIVRTNLTLGALDTNASPAGWIPDGGNITVGNNVDAFSDVNGDGIIDQPRVQGIPFRVFDFPLDLTLQPSNYTSASVVQLFYIVNRYHDWLYSLGFTEAAGNMQMDNFGRGGLAGDPVLAAVQVGGMFDNAFMMTTPDGVSAQMITLLFSGPVPMRDSALDAEVVMHECTHGVTERVLGGGVGVNYFGQSGAIHEGNSDWFAMTLLTEAGDDLGGVYANGGYLTYDILYPYIQPRFRQNYYFGIRRYPYSTNMLKNPLTFKDIDPTQASTHPGIPLSPIFGGGAPEEVHNAGEVWCVTLWEVRTKLVAKYGWAIGNRLALQTVLDGERLAPPNPNFLQLRDAILQADLVNSGGLNHGEIWAGFAKRGMGGSATSPDSTTTVGVVEAYDVPGVAFVSAIPDDSLVGNGNGAIDYNECLEVRILLHNGTTGLASNITATLSTTNPWVTVAQPASPYPPMNPGDSALNLIPFRISTSPDFPCGSSIDFALIINSTSDSRTNFFHMPSGFLSPRVAQFTNSTPVGIPDNNTNGVDSTLVVSDIMGPLGKITASLYLTHPADSELVVQLIAPNGAKINLALKEGGTGANFGTDCSAGNVTSFDDDARTAISAGTAPFIGTFRPDGPLAAFSGLAGTNVNGVWRLRVADTKLANIGTLQCWSLALFQTECTDGGGQCVGDLALQVVPSSEPTVLGSNLTYTITVTNGLPAPAYGVVVSNVVPSSLLLVSATNSQGTFTNHGPTLLFDLGTVSNGMVVTATVVVVSTQVGVVSNHFGMSVLSGDFNTTNNMTNVFTTVVAPVPNVVPAGSRLLAEGGPVNHGLDSGETNTVQLGLQNIGALGAENVTATLLAGNGVVLSAGPQIGAYGTIAAGTPPVFQPFTFTTLGVPGSVITATLQLATNGVFYKIVAFPFTLNSSGTFANPATITINQTGPASPYPSTNIISGLVGVVNKVTVTLSKFTHSYPKDVDVLLVSPTGEKVFLMGDAGGGTPGVTNRTLVFDQTSTNLLPMNTAVTSGTYRPTNYTKANDGDAFAAPAPVGPYSATLDSFRAINPNGAWVLFVMDDTAGDSGAISGGWSLVIDTVVPVDPSADLAVTISGSPETVLAGSPVSFTITVANNGLDSATGVVLTNMLPAGMSSLAASNSLGTVSNIGNFVIASMGVLPAGSNAVVTVTAATSIAGSPVTVATVTAAELDLNLLNNTASTVTTVRSASADLAVSIVASPSPAIQGQAIIYTLTVINLGPDEATTVVVTNTLPAGMTFQSVSLPSGSFTVLGNKVVCNLGTLAGGASVAFDLTAVVNQSGILADTANVVSATADPASANNAAVAAVTVFPPAPVVSPAGAALVGELNGAIDPGERGTLNLALRNSGTGATSNLVASLQQAGGVILSDGAQVQTYGALLPGGASVSQPFTFTASSASGSTLTATLALSNAGTNFGTVSFSLPMSTVRTVSSVGVVNIPRPGTNSGPASPYPSTISVSNMTDTVSRVTVTINQLTHSWVGDIDMLLVGPGGQKCLLMSDTGESPVANLNLTLDDTAVSSLPQSGSLTSGTFKPTDYEPGDAFAAPAPAGPYGAALSVFGGLNPNGDWKLFVMDDAGGDSGTLNGGWSVNFVTTRGLAGAADVGVTTTASPGAVNIGSDLTLNVTLNVTVANTGPGNATGVVLTDVLPAGFNLMSAVTLPTKGTLRQTGGTLTCNAGALAVGESFVLRIVGRPTLAGTLTNIASVTRAETDLNPANDVSVQTVTTPVQLVIQRLGNNIIVSWPYPSPGLILESSASLGSSANWLPDATPVQIVGSQNLVIMPVPSGSTLFFRIRKP